MKDLIVAQGFKQLFESPTRITAKSNIFVRPLHIQSIAPIFVMAVLYHTPMQI